MKSRHVLRAALLGCALLALAPLRAQQGGPPAGEEIDDALQDVLRLRARPKLDAERHAEQLLAASERVRACVRACQDEVVADELAFVGSSDVERSRRAQLLLAQVRHLPDGWQSQLAEDESLAARIYVAVRDRSAAEATPEERDRSVSDDRALALLESVSTELRSHLAKESFSTEKQDFVDDYQRDCAPRLSSPRSYVRGGDCTWVDLDGDEGVELVVACDSVWETFWLHDLAFVAVVHPTTRALRFWRLPVGARVRWTHSLDMDGDGAMEVVMAVEVMGGRAALTNLVVVSRGGFTSLTAPGTSFDLVLFRVGALRLIAVPAGLDWTFPGGAATERCGALAAQYHVFRFDAGEFVLVTPVWLPMVRSDE